MIVRKSAWAPASARLLIAALMLAMLAGCSLGGGVAPRSVGPSPRYQHVILIVMENSSYDDIIGASDAPHINALANTYGLATNYWAVAHPSEPNYVALIGGDTYGVADDASYRQNARSAPNLATQLEQAGLTWKTYQQSLPSAGYAGTTYPNASEPLYASKHNPFMNFLGAWPQSQQTETLAKIVPDTQLEPDLANPGTFPNFAFITPDLCHDMHGEPQCRDGLTRVGDDYVNQAVNAIMASGVWRTGNTAIIITWDEAEGGVSLGAPGIAASGGQVPTLVITNHGPHSVRDNTPYNHYALLLSIEDVFGLGCLRNSCPQMGGVTAMAPLFAVSG
jgi:phosphatidylinositol-3-phosphatase